MSAILALCCAISGAAALALEMLWMRSAGLVFGQTATTTATVLACYFAGLGGGAAWARIIRERAVQIYGRLEIGAAVGALWSFGVFRVLSTDSAQRWASASGAFGRLAAVATAVLPATLCLGATFPAVGQVLAEPGAIGRRGGLLYAVNTLGGVAGITAAGFGLPAAIGVRASYVAAAVTSALAGVLALGVDRVGRGGRGLPTPVATSRSASAATPTVSRGRLRIVAAGAGGLGLALEVLWTRLLAQVLHNSVYSFSAIALVFLLAIAAGAVVAALLLRRVAPPAIATAALVGAGVTTVAGVWLFMWRTDGLAYVGMQSGLGEYLVRIVLLAALSVGPAAFASGVVLPALWGMWSGSDCAARPLGDLSAANTFGAVAGAIAAGFVAIPRLGVHGSLLTAAVAYIVLADLLSLHHGRWRPLAYAALLAVVIANPMRAPLVHLRPEGEILHATAEGPNGIVTVVDADGDLQLRLDNYYVLGGTAAATHERRLGLLPLLLHPTPHRVAFVGLATGITASAAPALGVESTTVAEVVPEVAEAARLHFATWNAHLLERPDVHLVLDDGRRYLEASRERFDVIISDLFIPWHAGAGSLYASEMYQTVFRCLAPGGVFCQWLPLYQLTREEFAMITRTFLSVFEHASLWRADFYPNRPVVGLVAQLGTEPIDLAAVARRTARLPPWAEDGLLASPRGLVMLYAGDLAAVGDLFAAAPLNTDDRPLLEFTAPRLTRLNPAGDKDWFTGESLATFYATLDRRRAGGSLPFVGPADAIADARRAATALVQYALASARHDTATAARLEAEVTALVPEVVGGTVGSGSVADLADTRRALVGLRTEQAQMRQQVDEIKRRIEAMSAPRREPP